MLKSWTDTHYKLSENDWLYIAKHTQQGSVSLICPGYARGGHGFSIHFSSAQIEILEQLVELLRTLKETSQPKNSNQPLVYPVGREK
ncbi:MAG: hypothetical protein N3E45_00605 [Oscillatoriaceae bacterium SKW80]|nr:hypothetical protein [Oscillatoriaceae bacterium SKYG93]MCX8119329.1 hypothetical protein [Oscillatoriaceae bacterium SKW80]MDW8454796.1 hypothetical protein [Oscillatoriaceae cyanobacterium SKYGB_i_bin93]HIK28423.1 hypothetical protein [Oscillatoriaceae cyanobacterium M7585_C2015_266]